ncbi:DUF2344 domain-containing protein [bacterium]|nr:DUF2344 domain-containing protein [bacterium]
MKLAFGPALPVGTAGLRECFDVWLTRYVPASEVLERYSASMPGDLTPVATGYVGVKEPSLTASCTIGEYEVTISEEVDEGLLRQALDDIVAGREFAVEHKGKTKVFDLATVLPKGVEVRSCEGGVIVEMTTLMGPQGTLRPDVLVNAALSRGTASGAVTFVTRRDILISDEDGVRRPI